MVALCHPNEHDYNSIGGLFIWNDRLEVVIDIFNVNLASLVSSKYIV